MPHRERERFFSRKPGYCIELCLAAEDYILLMNVAENAEKNGFIDVVSFQVIHFVVLFISQTQLPNSQGVYSDVIRGL